MSWWQTPSTRLGLTIHCVFLSELRDCTSSWEGTLHSVKNRYRTINCVCGIGWHMGLTPRSSTVENNYKTFSPTDTFGWSSLRLIPLDIEFVRVSVTTPRWEGPPLMSLRVWSLPSVPNPLTLYLVFSPTSYFPERCLRTTTPRGRDEVVCNHPISTSWLKRHLSR